MVARIGLARAAAREGLTRAAGFATRNPVTQTPRIEHDKALGRVIVSLMKDDTELFKQFSDNPDFRHWLTDLVFRSTYQGRPA
jgi:type I restriction enzyme R subunit